MFLLRKKYQLLNAIHLIFKENFKKKIDFDWNKYPKRFQIIQKIIDKKKYNKYLEIGCFKDETFSEIKIKDKVGVDPISGGNVRLTSDNFFRTNKDKFDIIFIDGLHTFNQVKKDIYNSLNTLNEDGLLLIHDCLPKRIRDQMVPRAHEHWNGDVWKALVECRTLNDIDTYTCIADEGIGVIFKRQNKNILKIKNKNFKKLTFENYYINYKEYMNLISSEDLIKMV
tara:strand:+ start:961 stop:1638 length:678 start_codon:yes stop_codon:yes gene_type:complete